MASAEIISVNIKRLRLARGMNQQQVCSAAGISRQAYSGIEKGATKEPRVSNLQNIANALGAELMDLFAEPPRLSTVRFRSNSIKTAKDRARKEQYLIDAAYWLQDFSFLQELVGDKKEYKLTDVFKKIENLNANLSIKAAQLAREALGLKEDEPIGDIVGLMESAGIKIRTREFELRNCFGFSVSEPDGGPAIMVNTTKDITVEMQIFTVAHELGHLLLHPQAYDPAKSSESEQEEKEANLFAAHFLMPQKAFEKKMSESYGLGFIERVLHIKRFFSVSYRSILYRLADMKAADYKTLNIKFLATYKNKYGRSLKGHKEPYGLEPPDFVEDYLRSLVRRALDKALITVSRAAEILSVPLLEMREIINSWAEVAV